MEQLIFLIRHLESIKNINNTFSSIEGKESLSERSIKGGSISLLPLSEFISRNIDNCSFHCSNSVRAIDTMKMIHPHFDSMDYNIIPNFHSIEYAKNITTEEGLSKVDPRFVSDLTLYRTGLLSSYDIKRPVESETLEDFEKRIQSGLYDSLLNSQNKFQILVSHRSPITASLIFFARKFHNYPSDFFGFVPLDYGNICLIKITSRTPFNGKIQLVNTKPRDINFSFS